MPLYVFHFYTCCRVSQTAAALIPLLPSKETHEIVLMYTHTNNRALLIRMANFLAPRHSPGTVSFPPNQAWLWKPGKMST